MSIPEKCVRDALSLQQPNTLFGNWDYYNIIAMPRSGIGWTTPEDPSLLPVLILFVPTRQGRRLPGRIARCPWWVCACIATHSSRIEINL
ncbi:uncharacterized protein TEOVI_000435500 [Trypanosoma equiperdum]|uniref:Uncharacterized protein n=2 Tax=Trypanozoon TaxID=39700 RepID=Q383P8_TRYB2|nr:hypothetical protein, unlikely [Trypanosoma brucei brucei TREU927]EAN79983.1 hypothetical protein, unlikely [Trypanosoma brucei brucei TREU927]SCU72777.1 hypothetical protein, conserved [Trypanosoma equiperdum]